MFSEAQIKSVNDLSCQFEKMKLRRFVKNDCIGSKRKFTCIMSHNNKYLSMSPVFAIRKNYSQTPENSKTRKKNVNEVSTNSPIFSSSKRNIKTPRLCDGGNILKKLSDSAENSFKSRKVRVSRLKKNSSSIKPRDLFGVKENKNKKENNDENESFSKNGFNDSGISSNDSFSFIEDQPVQVVERKPTKVLKRKRKFLMSPNNNFISGDNEQTSSNSRMNQKVDLEQEKRSRL